MAAQINELHKIHLVSSAVIFKITFCVLTPGTKKAIPLQVWTGPEGSRRLRLPDFKTIGT
jgi:hypothetical protein